MSALLNLIRNQPAKVTGAVQAILNVFIVAKVIEISGETVGAINLAMGAVFALFVASQVTPNVKLPDSVVVAAAEGHPPIPEVPGVQP